jgi:uncharacterized RDD family membrane protein YckC
VSGPLVIRTPEGVTFSHALATPITRFLAWAVDVTCIGVIISSAGVIFRGFLILHSDLAVALSILSYFVVSIGYGMVAEWYWRGQTVGKRLLRLRVIDRQGLRLHPAQIIIRNLLRAVDALPGCYLLGGAVALIGKRSQRLGDLAAGTLVIRTPRLGEPELDRIATGRFNSLKAHPHLCARLRQKIGPAMAAVLLEAVLRRDELDAAERLALFDEFSGWLRCQVQFPDESVEMLTGEQYVRNVVELLFTPGGGS